jgi:hypothetical protein
MNYANLDSPTASVNARRRYPKCDLEPWYNLLNVNVEAGHSMTASARQTKEVAGSSINNYYIKI